MTVVFILVAMKAAPGGSAALRPTYHLQLICLQFRPVLLVPGTSMLSMNSRAGTRHEIGVRTGELSPVAHCQVCKLLHCSRIPEILITCCWEVTRAFMRRATMGIPGTRSVLLEAKC